MPPSTTISVPRMFVASSEARNRMVLPISSASGGVIPMDYSRSVTINTNGIFPAFTGARLSNPFGGEHDMFTSTANLF
jgi:hypothetical protein